MTNPAHPPVATREAPAPTRRRAPPPLLGLAAALLGASACASGPRAPFDTIQNGNVTMLRLQNYEPPAASPAAAAAPAIPGLPPQIQQWAQQAAPVLQQLLPPGLVPPNLLQAPALAAQPQASQEFRFHGRRVLGTQPVLDPELKEELSELFGDPDNFQLEHQPCDFTELGLGWTTAPGMPPYEVLISFSCNHVKAAQGFAWPHEGMGMKPKMVHGLARIISRLYPTTGGMVSSRPAAARSAALAAASE